jgi:hypothetical protein
MFRFIGWLMRVLRRERHNISRKGPPDYLTRWTLWGARFADRPRHNVYLHCFHRGDAESYCHDHPWPFWSLILWGGYWEWTREWDEEAAMYCQVRRWKWPGMLLRRPADWQHRVELPPGRRCWTLVWCGPKVRSWGFWCPAGNWIPWRQHQANQDAGGPGCE